MEDRLDDAIRREAVKSTLAGLGLSARVGRNQTKDGALGTFVLDAHADTRLYPVGWPEDETLEVFLKRLPGRIWEQAHAAGHAAGKEEMRWAFSF